MKLAIINYGMGNLGSVRRACTELGAAVILAEYPAALWEADRMVLPGVGGFSEGAARLQSDGWKEAIHRQVLEEGKPLLGICLGMQLLASFGDEGGLTDGLGLIPGHVRRLDRMGCTERIPHVGWNDIKLKTSSPLLAHIPSGTDFYFVHSYAFEPIETDYVTASVYCGAEVTAAVADRHIFGVQFHPEKSSKAGRRLLQNFLDYRAC
jgi:glutamine amidotransferase